MFFLLREADGLVAASSERTLGFDESRLDALQRVEEHQANVRGFRRARQSLQRMQGSSSTLPTNWEDRQTLEGFGKVLRDLREFPDQFSLGTHNEVHRIKRSIDSVLERGGRSATCYNKRFWAGRFIQPTEKA